MDSRRDAKWRHRRPPTRRYDSYDYDYEQDWYKNDYYGDYGYAGGQYNEGSWQRLDHLYGPQAGMGVPPMQVMADPRVDSRLGQEVQSQSSRGSERAVPSGTPAIQPAEAPNAPPTRPGVGASPTPAVVPQGVPSGNPDRQVVVASSSSSMGEGSDAKAPLDESVESKEVARQGRDMPQPGDSKGEDAKAPRASAAGAMMPRASIEDSRSPPRGGVSSPREVDRSPRDPVSARVADLQRELTGLRDLVKHLSDVPRQNPGTGNPFRTPTRGPQRVEHNPFRSIGLGPLDYPSASAERESHAHHPASRSREGSSIIDDRLASGWMRDVKQYDSNRKTFRSWLLDAELRMDPSWDVHTRIKYLRAKLDLTGLVRLEQVLQYLEDHGISRSWEALRERLLLVFPGAMDKHIALCRMMDVRQEEGEPFLIWVNR